MTDSTIPEKIREAMAHLGNSFSTGELIAFIVNQSPATNRNAVRTSIIAHTVNQASRVDHNVNKKERLTNTGSRYDLLFSPSYGQLEAYDPQLHGVWAIVSANNTLTVRQIESPMNPLFTPDDIRWIKHISNTEAGHAYMNTTEEPFVLHVPTKHKDNIMSPAVGEIILLYQNVEGNRVFTHLVTPVNNELVPAPERADYAYGRLVQAIAFAPLTSMIPASITLWRNVLFNGISQGNVCNISNVESVRNLDELKLDTWQNFAPFFLPSARPSLRMTTSIMEQLEDEDPEYTAREGGLKLVTHFARERDRKIVNQKKEQALKLGRYFCEVCTFSFVGTYSANYIECHHLDFIGGPDAIERETTLNKLALVCSNCHRMLHKRFDGEYLTLVQLRELMDKMKTTEA